MRPRPERRAGRAAGAALACLLACDPARPALPTIELPADLAAMEPPVQRQFRDAHDRLSELAAHESASPASLAEAYGRLGMLFHAYELRPSARLCYDEAARLAPETFRWPFYQAELELKGGDLAAAERAIRRARELEPDQPAAAALHGTILVGLGRLDEADRLATERSRVDPTYAPAWILRARIALIRRDPRAAVAFLREAVALQPASSEAQYLLGQAYAATGDREAAARQLEAVPDRNLQFAQTSLDEPLLRDLRRLRLGSLDRLRAGARAVQTNQRLALVELDQALAADPTLLHARASRGWVLLELGRLDEAEAELRRVLAEDPDHEHSLRFLATLEQRRGDVVAAEALWRHALEVNPVSREARFGLAEINRRRGRLAEALVAYAEAAALDPGMARAQFWRVVLLDAAGRTAEARALLDSARRAMPEDRDLHLLAVRRAAGDGEAMAEGPAEQVAADLFARRADLPAAETVALVAACQGDFRSALVWQEAAVAAVAATGAEAPWATRRLARYRTGSRPSSAWETDEDSADLAIEVAATATGDPS